MSSDSDAQFERKKIQEALKRIATPERRRADTQERRINLDQRAEISRGRQRKAEEVDARLRRTQQLVEAQATEAAKEVDKAWEESRRRFLKRLGDDWGRRLGHYKGARPPYTGKSEWGSLDPEELVEVARASRRVAPGTWVTDFSDWVFGLEHPQRNPAWLDMGKTVERHLITRLQSPAERAKALLRRFNLKSNRWRILFEDNQAEESRSFSISSLTVGGKCLIGKPDLVLEELHTGDIYIVERKASNKPIPTQCWHNVRAQLWAYSQIDDWANRPNVTLCAEVWRHTDQGTPTDSQVFSWERGDARLNAGIQALFELYH